MKRIKQMERSSNFSLADLECLSKCGVPKQCSGVIMM